LGGVLIGSAEVVERDTIPELSILVAGVEPVDLAQQRRPALTEFNAAGQTSPVGGAAAHNAPDRPLRRGSLATGANR